MTRFLFHNKIKIFFSSTEEGIAKIKEKGRHCIQDIIGKPGWSCNDGTCLPLSNVCDNFDTQCPDGDDSDEVDGCWLFPEETCKSVGAQKMVKCPHSEQCVPDQGQDLCQNQNKPTNDTSCPFRCKSGHCIAKTFVCNRKFTFKLKKRGFVFYFSCKSCVCLLFTF